MKKYHAIFEFFPNVNYIMCIKTSNRKIMKRVTKKELSKLNVLELLDHIVELSSDNGLNISSEIRPYTNELASRLGLTPIQVLLLSVFVDMSDDSRINHRDLARHFDVRPIKILTIEDEIDVLAKRGVIIKRVDSDGDITYRIPKQVIDGLRKGMIPEPEKFEDLTAAEFFDLVDSLLKRRKNEEIPDDDFYKQLREIIETNQQLYVCDRLRALNLDDDDLVLLLLLCNIYINNHDDRIQRGDIEDYFERRNFRNHVGALENGTHVLMTVRLVEHSCVDGQVDSESWRITDYCKMDILREINLTIKTNVRTNLTHYESVTEKKLYYNKRVTQQVNDLCRLLEKENMHQVQKRLKDHGMRTGFACLFYGAPGTGKTETALQLARLTKRDIMLVDVPSIRSKWVGETEKNIKGIFDRYRNAAEKSEIAPILLFNEADALLNKRSEGAIDSVDKMENAMQNIILQEMEKLDGIMIATTNLTGSLDAAFERRFLYKIEFDKPTAAESKYIWKAMMPELTNEETLTLAEKFSFSGGQIENIARKQMIDSIIKGQTPDIDHLIAYCNEENINNTNRGKKIGF